MRLFNPSVPSAEFSESSLNAELFDQMLRASERKRSGGLKTPWRSSLDFKPGPRDKHSTTPTARQKESKRGSEQAQEQQQPVSRPVVLTRARRSSGIPPRSLGLPDLDYLSEDEMQTLYNDPEFAEAAAAESAKPRTKTRSTRKRSKSKGRLSEYPAHLQDRIEEGVPVFQWAFLLMLLGILFYQLRKLLILPPMSSNNNKPNRSSSRRIKDRQTTKSKVKALPGKTNDASKATGQNQVKEFKKTSLPSSSKNPSSSKKKKPKISSKSEDNGHVSKDTKEKPISSNGNHNSSEVTPSSMTEFATTLMDDQSGWQPVGKKAPKSSQSSPPAASENRGKETIGINETPLNPEPKEDVHAFPAKGPELVEPNIERCKPAGNKNKKQINNNTITSDRQVTPSVISDAALALQLHEEEAQADRIEDEWAEVTIKSKRK